MICRLDHLVLTVQNIDQTVDFYTRILGMEKEVFGAGRVALKFGWQKFNLHEVGQELEPKADSPTPGSGDICLITDLPIQVAYEHVRAQGIEI